ncbi:centrosomal protein of 78 kDa [Penaeus vannamei]|uniref:centrosomal protein of 78 kDa n=1 Tax=Penaeus vannamei TaxID=6689 RepID=UPI00387F8539
MSPKAPNIQLLGETLTRHYRLSCELYNTYPIGRFTHQLSQGNLEINVSDIDLDHLEALCHTLQNKVTPLQVFIYIPPGKEVGVKTIQRIMKGISASLSVSMTVSVLSISNVTLRGNNLSILCQGLSKTRHLKSLSLRGCELGNNGAELVCQSVKNVPSITHLALTHCSVSEKGACAVASLMQHQRMNRDSAMWQDTLRLRQPHLDGMRGLRRVTLNDNPHLGDNGLAAIADVLYEDLWIKAIDLQHCGLSNESGMLMKKVLKANQVLEIVDLRRNPFVANHLVNEVTALLTDRQDQYSVQQYVWLDLMDSPHGGWQVNKNPEGKVGTYAATGRNKLKETRGLNESQETVKKKPSLPRQFGIPWRIEHRLYERREGMVPGTLVETVPETAKDAFPKESDSPQQVAEMSSHNFHKISKKLEHYKKRYHKERQLRKRAERRLIRLQTKIKESHILDEGTVSHIETCFQKFQKFLSHLQDIGLNKQLIIPEFGKENKEKSKRLDHITQPWSDSADTVHDSEYRQMSRLVPELYEPSNIPHPIVVFNGPPPESDMPSHVINRQSDVKDGLTVNPSISVEEVQISREPLEYDTLLDCKRKSHKTANESEQKTTLCELSEDIKIGADMLSLFPKGQTLEEVEDNYESQGTSDEDEDDNCEQDEEDFSSIRIATTYHTREPVIMERTEGTSSKDEESEISKGKPSLITRDADSDVQNVNSSESQDLSKRIKDAEDIYVMSYEIPAERIEAMSVSSADISSQNVFEVHLPENEKFLNLDQHEAGERAEGIIEKEQMVKENSEYSHSRKHEGQTHRESPLEYAARREIPTGYISYAEHAERKRTYKTDDLANVVQSTEVSETDDEKLRMRQTTFNFSGRSGSISSSVSITEQLSHSHNKWSTGKGETKGRSRNIEGEPSRVDKPGNKEKNIIPTNTDKIQINLPSSSRLKQEIDDIEYDSDFEVSDVEGVSISASSLTSTSIPDDLVTPGEEEF